ncbi:MAG: PfkB family carbohydrate kinase [Myxococcota bacterium]
MQKSEQPVLVVGSVAFDTIHNHLGTHKRILGGSATYASIAASYFAPVRLVGVVGGDFPDDAVEMFKRHEIDVSGLEVSEGETFHWEGRYTDDLTARTSLSTELNVFADFHPKIPESQRSTPYVMLGNIAPELQLEVIEQIGAPRLVIADTMNFWIDGKPDALKKVLKKVNVLVINEEEARQLAAKHNIIDVAQALLGLGPSHVVIKRGEYGAMLFHRNHSETDADFHVFNAAAFPTSEVVDPTGAGDTFAGGFLGYLASRDRLDDGDLRRAVVYGSALASFCVEGVGVANLTDLSDDRIEKRYQAFRAIAHF